VRTAEILKFTGDGFLASSRCAIRNVDHVRLAECVKAAEQALALIARERQASIGGFRDWKSDLVLHFGDWFMGNVADKPALDSHVIGAGGERSEPHRGAVRRRVPFRFWYPVRSPNAVDVS